MSKVADKLIGSLIGVLSKNNLINDMDEISNYLGFSVKEKKVVLVIKIAAIEQLMEVQKTITKELFSQDFKFVVQTGAINLGFWKVIENSQKTNNVVVIDIRDLNQIIEYNHEFGYVLIEPGVSFVQLYKFLGENGTEYTMSGIMGSYDTSVTSHAMQRGIGMGAFGNREEHVEVVEFVTSAGELIRVSKDENNLDYADQLSFGLSGLNYRSLLFQNDRVTVTKLQVFLQRTPNFSTTIDVAISQGLLSNYQDKLGKLLEAGIVDSSMFITNNIFVCAMVANKKIDNLSDNSSSESMRVADWNSTIFISGYNKDILNAKLAIISEDLKEFIKEKNNKVFSKVVVQELLKLTAVKPDRDYREYISELSFLGFVPNNLFENVLAWNIFDRATQKKQNELSAYVLSFKVPNAPHYINEVLRLVKHNLGEHFGMTPIFWQVKTPQLLILVVALIYDDSNILQKNEVEQLRSSLVKVCEERHYCQYRSMMTKGADSELSSSKNLFMKSVSRVFDSSLGMDYFYG